MKSALCLFLFAINFLYAGIEGYWKSINETTGYPQCVIAVYEYENVYYGRIIATYDENGKMKEDIYKAKERAPGVVGHPFYCGLDIIWGLQNTGASYKGKILDPQKGNIYNAELWNEGPNLVVRGKLLIFGRNQTWLPATDADFPKGFKKPALKDLVPKIPEVN
ncbi:MAG: DUF2147 domain-containing protein [Verrucomicrobia bacterium]|nr:DUF2147 domain-containing protein [Verrucomicrobiota bacterium]